jgi:hypothetical protein
MLIVTQGSRRRGHLDLMEAVFAAISVQSLVHAPRADIGNPVYQQMLVISAATEDR